MAKVSVAGIADFVEDQPLDKSPYRFQIYDAKQIELNDKLKLQINLVCTEGPTQADGSEPEGRKLVDFHPLSGYENMKDGGKFCKGRLVSLLKAAGIDYSSDEFDFDELIDSEVIGIVKIQKDLDGEPREQISKYKPVQVED